MANALTPVDAHAIINELVKEATGQASITAVDTSSFVAAAELVLATGVENTLNALSLVLGRTLMAVRPYNAKLAILNQLNSNGYAARLRKISFYSRDALPAGDVNTDLYTNLADGYDNGTNGATGSTPATNSTPSMWVQNQPIPLECNFSSIDVYQDSTTVYEYQLKQAFRDEASFNAFVAGILTEKGNDIESQKEAFNRMTLLNHIAAVLDAGATESKVNLTSAFNTYYGLTGASAYTTAELLTTHFKEFLEFFIATFKEISDRMTYRSTLYHVAPTKSGHYLLRHTPKDKQRLIMYNPFWIKAQAMIMPEIFNDQYLQPPQFESVLYWQSINAGSGIEIYPAVTDFDSTHTSTYGTKIKGSKVDEDYILGVLFDADAIMTDFQLERTDTTVLESRRHYRNIWFTYHKGAISDLTENCVVFYMADPST